MDTALVPRCVNHRVSGLGTLVEYLARGPLSNERHTIRPKDDVELKKKLAWKKDTTHLLFSPEEFIEKLLALILPPPPSPSPARQTRHRQVGESLRTKLPIHCLGLGENHVRFIKLFCV